MFEEVCLYRPSADAKGTSSPSRGSKAEFDDKSGGDADAKEYKGHK